MIRWCICNTHLQTIQHQRASAGSSLKLQDSSVWGSQHHRSCHIHVAFRDNSELNLYANSTEYALNIGLCSQNVVDVIRATLRRQGSERFDVSTAAASRIGSLHVLNVKVSVCLQMTSRISGSLHWGVSLFPGNPTRVVGIALKSRKISSFYSLPPVLMQQNDVSICTQHHPYFLVHKNSPECSVIPYVVAKRQILWHIYHCLLHTLK